MTAKLYLIRHGIAADKQNYKNDEERPLTDEGHRKTQQVAKRLHQMDISFDSILTSPLVRAKQTAEILQAVGLSTKIEESKFLIPDGDIKPWLSWLEQWHQAGGSSLALVGHQPDLANWAEILVWGQSREAIVLKKAGVIGLSLPETNPPVGRCLMFWLTPPKLLL